MALMELVICLEHKHPIVAQLHATAVQRGDVIEIMPEGFEWGKLTCENPDWIIIKSDITKVEKEALLESGRPGETQWWRRVGINVEGLKTGDVLTRQDLMARTF